jgi:hypothetical protein
LTTFNNDNWPKGAIRRAMITAMVATVGGIAGLTAISMIVKALK